jgi:hypothetical protein
LKDVWTGWADRRGGPGRPGADRHRKTEAATSRAAAANRPNRKKLAGSQASTDAELDRAIVEFRPGERSANGHEVDVRLSLLLIVLVGVGERFIVSRRRHDPKPDQIVGAGVVLVGVGPGMPEPSGLTVSRAVDHQLPDGYRLVAKPILAGLHHEYRLEPIAA